MGRSAWLTLAAAGLSTTMLVLTFPGCGFADKTIETGKCEDDGNPCTNDECPSGATVHEAVPTEEKRPCTRGINAGLCVREEDGAAVCVLDCVTNGTPCNCTNADECQTSTDCSKWSCTAGKCENKLVADDTVVGMDMPNDCLQPVCKAGVAKLVPAMDPKPDTAGDCKKNTCADGMHTTTNDDDPPADTPEDCNLDSCVDGQVTKVPKDDDKPMDTGCIKNTCTNGVLTPANASPGTVCATGFCDTAGACVACFDKPTWDACGGKNCAAKLCPKEACTANADCKNGMCVDGYCCNTTCTEECKSCAVAGKLGECTNIPYYMTDDFYTHPVFMTQVACENISRCNGQGKCLKIIGKGCGADAECISGDCAADPALVCLGAKGEACGAGVECVSGVCNGMGKCD